MKEFYKKEKLVTGDTYLEENTKNRKQNISLREKHKE